MPLITVRNTIVKKTEIEKYFLCFQGNSPLLIALSFMIRSVFYVTSVRIALQILIHLWMTPMQTFAPEWNRFVR